MVLLCFLQSPLVFLVFLVFSMLLLCFILHIFPCLVDCVSIRHGWCMDYVQSMQGKTHIYTYIYIYIHIYTCAHTHIYIYIPYIHISMYIYTYMHMDVLTHTHIYVYIYIYTCGRDLRNPRNLGCRPYFQSLGSAKRWILGDTPGI